MPTTMAFWRLADNGVATPVAEERLSAEALIESAVESAPELLGSTCSSWAARSPHRRDHWICWLSTSMAVS